MRVTLLAFWLCLIGVACGDEFTTEQAEPPPCNEDPWSCPAATTCWVDETPAYGCLVSGSATEGQACVADAGATPQCGDGLFCLPSSPNPQGPATCHRFCSLTDPSHKCDAPEQCYALAPDVFVESTMMTTKLDTIYLCATN